MNMSSQLRVNRLAIISLVVALTALGYNTYRNELTEANRSIRLAGFEALMELNKLQLLIDDVHYGKKPDANRHIKGWSHVLYINDMGHLISDDVLALTESLRETWKNEWEGLDQSEPSNAKISQAINLLRGTILNKINSLD